jgi:predicted lysophospholipase L1 biosynthesis ABC-type transport system permease subunit
LGQRIQFVPSPQNSSWVTIVGVTGDIKSDGFDTESGPQMYVPEYQFPGNGIVIFLHTGEDPTHLGELLRQEVQAVDPGVPVFRVRTMDEVLSKSLAQRRFALELLGIFAGVAVSLASIGIYGVMAYTFSQRTNEIGIRMALGAKRMDILQMALGEGIKLIVIGVASGIIGSVILTRYLNSMLFEVKSVDPLTFVGISLLLATVALLACWIPAHKASRVEPLTALRYE